MGDGRPVYALGYCRTHYHRSKRGEDMDAPIRAKRRSNVGSRQQPVTYRSAHRVVKVEWGPASQYLCVDCGDKAAEWAYDGTDPTQLYGPREIAQPKYWSFFSMYPEFYMPMCRKCHIARDNERVRLELHEYRLWRHTTGGTLPV